VVASVMLWGRSARKLQHSFQRPKLLSRDKTLADDPGIDKIPGTECYSIPYPSLTENCQIGRCYVFGSPKKDSAKGIVVTVPYSSLYKVEANYDFCFSVLSRIFLLGLQ